MKSSRYHDLLGYLRPSLALGLIYGWVVKYRFRSCGRRLQLALPVSIRGHRNISIGNNFASMGGLYLYAEGTGQLRIGDNCSINTNVQLGATPGTIQIGNNVIIAPNVVLRAANHHIARDRIIREQPSVGGDIVVEDDVWIGSNAVITAGVVIARGAVVGAGAVVTRSTEQYSIVGGVPAKKIGERV